MSEMNDEKIFLEKVIKSDTELLKKVKTEDEKYLLKLCIKKNKKKLNFLNREFKN